MGRPRFSMSILLSPKKIPHHPNMSSQYVYIYIHVQTPICHINIYHHISTYIYSLVVSTPLNISQLGLLFLIYGKIKNAPNHQLVCIYIYQIISTLLLKPITVYHISPLYPDKQCQNNYLGAIW